MTQSRSTEGAAFGAVVQAIWPVLPAYLDNLIRLGLVCGDDEPLAGPGSLSGARGTARGAPGDQAHHAGQERPAYGPADRGIDDLQGAQRLALELGLGLETIPTFGNLAWSLGDTQGPEEALRRTRHLSPLALSSDSRKPMIGFAWRRRAPCLTDHGRLRPDACAGWSRSRRQPVENQSSDGRSGCGEERATAVCAQEDFGSCGSRSST